MSRIVAVNRPDKPNWLTLPLIMLVIPLGSAHISSVAPFLNEMSRDLGVSIGVMGQLGTAQFIGAFVSAILLAPFIAQLRLRRVLFMSAMTLAVASVLTAAVLSFPAMFAARIIAGLAAGIAIAGALAAVGRAWPNPDDRNKKTAFVIAALAGGPGLMPPLLRLIAAPTSWQIAIGVYAGIVGLIGILVLLALPALEGTPNTGGMPLKSRLGESVRVFMLPMVGMLILLRLLIWMSGIAIFTYLAGFFVVEYPGKEAWIGPLFAIFSLGGFMVGSLILGLVYSRLGGPARVLAVSGLVLPASGIAFAWITPAPLVTASFLLVWGFAGGLYIPTMINMLYTYSGRHQGAAIFTDSALQQAAAIAGAGLGGLALSLTAGFAGWQVFVTLASVATLLPLALVVRSLRADVAAAAA